MTVAELFEIWLDYKKIEVKISTISTYSRKIEAYILPFLGKYDLRDINITHISNFIVELMNTLSSKSVIDIKTILQSALLFAYKQGYIDKRIEIPSPPHIRAEVETFTNDEQKKITDYILSDLNNRNFLILLSLCTGMRAGELCALQYKDIKNICHIKHTVQRIKNFETDTTKTILYMGTPKSKLSKRPVPINASIINIFCGIYNSKLKDCYILTNTSNFTEPRYIEKSYEKLLRECKIEHKKFHTLRHTFATNAMRVGIDLQTLAEIMGLSVKVLISTYLHSDIQEKINSMEKMKMAL